VKIGTIVARNYLPQARVLADSVRQHHPDVTLEVLVVDGEPADALAHDSMRIVLPDQLPLSAEQFSLMRLIYGAMELCTAVKPSLLQFLLQDDDVAVYLDPDIRLFAPIDELADAARAHGIVLTPHAVEPYPRDGLAMDERTIMRAGAFNLGFIAVGTGSESFLNWWAERLAREALVAPEAGLFTDQRWIDFVPSLFPCHILRDKGWNVAYWNLHERPLTRDPATGSLFAGGSRVRFFHYSGYDPSKPHIVSKHQGPMPRAVRTGQPILAEILDDYGADLLAAGWAESSKIPYRWDFIGGVPIPQEIRRFVYASTAPGTLQPPPPNPFAPGGPEAFRAWLSEPVARHGGRHIPRIVLEKWRRRPDLQERFPQPLDVDLPGLAQWTRWALKSGKYPEFSDFLELDPVGVSSPSATSAGPGITICGYLRAELGVGEAGRRTLLGAEQVGLPVSTLTYNQTHSRQNHEFFDREGDIHDLSIICVNADQTTSFLGHAHDRVRHSRMRVGLWFWEVEHFPDHFAAAAQGLDEVWAASEFVRDAIAATVNVPVRLMPLPIVPDPPSLLGRRHLGLPEDKWVCAFAFDTLSVLKRKNPQAVMRAFMEAFAVDDDAFLVIKVNNAWADHLAIDYLTYLAGHRPDIQVVVGTWTPVQMRAFYQVIDCYVSLHRSEGLGLTMAQAMAQAKPVVATSYSGNLAFMNDANSLLVPHTKQEVGEDAAPYLSSALWAEPDVSAAADMLRQLRKDDSLARSIGERAAHDIRTLHHPGVCGDFLRDQAMLASQRVARRA
jgi:glycosyltransferase involved in cell wall biosynthesis